MSEQDWAELAFDIIAIGCDECQSVTCKHCVEQVTAKLRTVRAQALGDAASLTVERMKYLRAVIEEILTKEAISAVAAIRRLEMEAGNE